MSGAILAVPHWIVYRPLDILKSLNGCSVTVRIKMSGTDRAGVLCIRQPVLDTSRSPGYYSSIRPKPILEVKMARLHYTLPRERGMSILLGYCWNAVPM